MLKASFGAVFLFKSGQIDSTCIIRPTNLFGVEHTVFAYDTVLRKNKLQLFDI